MLCWPYVVLDPPCGASRDHPQPLAKFEQRYQRNEAMARAYLSGQHSMAAIARHFRVHYSTVSRAVMHHEGTTKK